MSAYAVPIVRGVIHGYPRHNLGHLYVGDGVISQIPKETISCRLSISGIRDRVAAVFGLPVGAMIGHQRPEYIAWPRQIAMKLAYELTGASLNEVGRMFGGRDHGTVLYACKHVANRMATEPAVREQVEKLKARLGA